MCKYTVNKQQSEQFSINIARNGRVQKYALCMYVKTAGKSVKLDIVIDFAVSSILQVFLMQMSVQNDSTYIIVQVLFLWERASD